MLSLADAGLRLGEARALTWGQVQWGIGAEDRSRSLVIDRSRPTHGAGVEPPKSGRARRVDLSARLGFALRELYERRLRPGPEVEVFSELHVDEDSGEREWRSLDVDNFRGREWRRIRERAKTGHCALKDLRDSFASQLLTAGVQLAYVSAQLGHADVAVTAKHYAAWCGGAEYRDPLHVRPNELPAVCWRASRRISIPLSFPSLRLKRGSTMRTAAMRT